MPAHVANRKPLEELRMRPMVHGVVHAVPLQGEWLIVLWNLFTDNNWRGLFGDICALASGLLTTPSEQQLGYNSA
eukprot:5376939-Amphidinium_carterae.1